MGLLLPFWMVPLRAYHSNSVSPEFQEIERLRSKARHDEAQAIYDAKFEEKLETAKKALQMGMSIADIINLTGLTQSEIKKLEL